VGSIVVIQALSDAFKVGVAVDDGIEPEADEGEYEIYSSAGGTKKARVKCEVGGNVIHNEGSRLVARKDDSVLITAETDNAFITWIGLVTGAINILAPGSIPVPPPVILTGTISEGSSTVKVP
jgi:hypothetical protein